MLAAGLDAFAARAALADAAQRSLDAQYYIWHADVTGRLLLHRLWAAAERGVRVRVLLDDIHTEGQDAMLAALASHPNVQIRLFNPFVNRRHRVLDYVLRFGRVNHRMHNKSFTVDGRSTVVGGRNVGDEYFQAHAELDFADLDVLGEGPVARDVTQAFEKYWNSRAAYPVHALGGPAEPGEIARLGEALQRAAADPAAVAYLKALAGSAFAERTKEGGPAFIRACAEVLYDDPEKAFSDAPAPALLLAPKLIQALRPIQSELVLVSPYLVPGKEGVALLEEVLSNGARVRVLTNSLAATDVAAVHAGYSKYRKALLRCGVELRELKRGATAQSPGGHLGLSGSSRASLHAKTMVADRKRVFVGSFNFDLRSVRLNTEMGVIFESAEAGERIARSLARESAERAYEVRLSGAPANPRLEWVDRGAGERRYPVEPDTSLWRRLGVSLLSVLPIEHLL